MAAIKIVRTQAVVSPANPLVKSVRRAIARGTLTDDGCCVAEGFHLLEEALRSDREVPVVLAAESVRETVARHIAGLKGSRTVVVADALFQAIASTETTQGVISLVRPAEWSIPQLFRGWSLVVVLDGVQDPGNAGTIVRAAEAFGASGVLFIKGTVSPHHPRTLRASAGSLFRVPYVSGIDATLARASLAQHGVSVFAAVPFTGRQRLIGDVDFSQRCAFLIGSEGRGISNELQGCAEDIAIPTIAVESLNAAVAASIMLYEARRQRAGSASPE